MAINHIPDIRNMVQQAHTATLLCNRFQTEQHQNIGAAWLAASQGYKGRVMSELAKRLQALKQYGFKDENGHPLENCQEFVGLEMALKCDQASDAPLSLSDEEAIKGAIIYAATCGRSCDLEVLTDELIKSFKRISIA